MGVNNHYLVNTRIFQEIFIKIIMKKNAIGPVVGTALLLVVTVVAIVTFQSWWVTYSSDMLVDVEKKSSSAVENTDVEIVHDNVVYFQSTTENLSISKIEVNGLNCDLESQDYPFKTKKGMNSIKLNSSCFENSSSISEIVVVTDDKVHTKYFTGKEISQENEDTIETGGFDETGFMNYVSNYCYDPDDLYNYSSMTTISEFNTAEGFLACVNTASAPLFPTNLRNKELVFPESDVDLGFLPSSVELAGIALMTPSSSFLNSVTNFSITGNSKIGYIRGFVMGSGYELSIDNLETHSYDVFTWLDIDPEGDDASIPEGENYDYLCENISITGDVVLTNIDPIFTYKNMGSVPTSKFSGGCFYGGLSFASDYSSNLDSILIGRGTFSVNSSPVTNVSGGIVSIRRNHDITDLSGLSSLESVNTRINIIKNDNLVSLEGLNNLKSAGLVSLDNLSSLVTLDGLDNLNGEDGSDLILRVQDLKNLESIGPMESLTTGQLELYRLDSLNNITGLSNLSSGSIRMTPSITDRIDAGQFVPMDNSSPFCTGTVSITKTSNEEGTGSENYYGHVSLCDSSYGS